MNKDMKKLPKKNEKEKSLHELIKSNTYLQQYCNFLGLEISKVTMKCNELAMYIVFMEKITRENNKMLEIIMANLGTKTVEKLKKDLEQNEFRKNSTPFAQPIENKFTSPENVAFALHDDLTTKCPNCKAIMSKKEQSCKECGFKINK